MPKSKQEAPEKETSQKKKAPVPEGYEKKGKVTKVTDDAKHMAAMQEQLKELTGLVTALTDKSKQDDVEKTVLTAKLAAQDEVLHPDQGPGPACEAYKVHMGEALQLRMTEEPGVYEPVPVGMRVRQHDMILFLVKDSTPDNAPLEEGMVSNCRSLYTDEYKYLLPKKPGSDVREKAEAHLCRKHARVLLGISEDQKLGGLNEVKDA